VNPNQPKPATGCDTCGHTASLHIEGVCPSESRKPATGEHQASILSENAKTVRTLQEWTPALLSRLFDAECSPEEAIKRICSLHNAALAADKQPKSATSEWTVETIAVIRGRDGDFGLAAAINAALAKAGK
jgi:hypothetical protein